MRFGSLLPFREKLKRGIENALRVRILSHPLPRGLEWYYDVNRITDAKAFRTVIDIGANVGQSAKSFQARFPAAIVHSFEPDPDNFSVLERNCKEDAQIACHNIALSEEPGEVALTVGTRSDMRRIGDEVDKALQTDPHSEIVRVRSETLDNFCATKNINKVNFVKIDTEGHEMSVLAGAKRMLIGSSIDFLLIEAGINRRNSYHTQLESIDKFLDEYDYLPIGFYDQTSEWPTQQHHLRRADVLYCSARLVGEARPENLHLA